MSWSQSQLQMLRAMGHQPMLLAGSAQASAVATPDIRLHSQAPASAKPPQAGEFLNLLSAIRLAAGSQDVSGLVTDLARLRRDPAMKRALWPALRALRRNH